MKIHVRINSPEKVLWEGEADSVSSENSKGPFDILPLHANFITFIENKPILVRMENSTKEYKFDNSVIYASQNKVFIYTHL